MDLDQLIVQFQKKDAKAFETLYTMYCKSVHGIIFNIVRNSDLSDEIMNDVFMKAWDNAASYSSKKGRFFTWLITIARRTAIDTLRSKGFKQEKQNLDAQFFVDIIVSQENLGRTTDFIGIKAYVNKLADKCKRLIELLYFKGFTQKEASETLDMPIGTIKTHNRACINELRSALDVK